MQHTQPWASGPGVGGSSEEMTTKPYKHSPTPAFDNLAELVIYEEALGAGPEVKIYGTLYDGAESLP